MFKSAIALAAAAPMMAAPALAGPYVNVEANAGWTGDDYTSTTTDIHVGYEGAIGESGASFYVQAGPCLLYTSPSPRDQRGSRMPSSA